MKLSMSHKGEITTTQIVVLIILILSFAIILFLIFSLNLGQTTNQDICHNSVILSAKNIINKVTPGPLDCTTNYVCISGSKCSDANIDSTIKVDPTNKDQVMAAIANQMAQCWWMFGEGNAHYGADISAVSCGICSTITFGQDVQKDIPYISNQEFYGYLAKTQKSTSQTYLQYLYGVSNPSDVIALGTELNFNIGSKIDTSQKQSVITAVDRGLISSNYIPPFIVPVSEIGSTKCKDFITKA